MKNLIELQIIFSVLIRFVILEADKNFQHMELHETIHLLCQYNGSIEGCSFIIPGEKFEIKLNPNQTKESSNTKYKYFGAGFNKGDCGILLDNMTFVNQDFVCILSLNNTFDLHKTIKIRKFDNNLKKMIMPTMKILNNGPLIVDQTLVAECATKSNKVVNFLWLLNDKILNETNDAMKKKFEYDKSIYESKSILKYKLLNSTNNGSVLKCRTKYNNDSFIYIDTTLTLKILNETNIEEPLIGFPYEISIKFFAFPRVLSSKWMVNKRIIYYGKASNEFSSKELKYLGNNQWNAFLYISNVTEENICYNYTLQVNDSEGTKFYKVRIDNSIKNKVANQVNNSVSTIKPIKNNFFTTLPEYRKGIKLNSHRRTPIRNLSNIRENNFTEKDRATETRERKIKIIHKHQQLNTTKIASAIISTTTTKPTTQIDQTSIVLSTDARNTNDKKNVKYSIHYIKNENYMNNTILRIDNKYESTTLKIYNISKNENIDLSEHFLQQLHDYLLALIFSILIFVIIIITVLLFHYRHQAMVLKNEIIQMNLENCYNHSCLTFNEYSSTRLSDSFYGRKQPLSSSVDETIGSTNTPLYQSIEDIDSHIYDEIINSMDQQNDIDNNSREEIESKLNNYENNETLNSINEILIPKHCHSLIKEVDEYESSQLQKLSKLETTYI